MYSAEIIDREVCNYIERDYPVMINIVREVADPQI